MTGSHEVRGSIPLSSTNKANNLVLISPFFPEGRFTPANAMARNKFIYLLKIFRFPHKALNPNATIIFISSPIQRFIPFNIIQGLT